MMSRIRVLPDPHPHRTARGYPTPPCVTSCDAPAVYEGCPGLSRQSGGSRYPAPGRRVYDTQTYQQQQPQSYGNRGYAPAPQGYYYQPRQSYQPRGLFTYQD